MRPNEGHDALDSAKARLAVGLAYALIWFCVLGFVVLLFVRLHRLEREVHALERTLEGRAASTGQNHRGSP